MCGVFAEFERAMIQERVRAGLNRARAQGKALGRPKVSTEVERKVMRLHSQGVGMLRIAGLVGCGSGTVQRIVKAGADTTP